ncbi:MAG: UDP-phosphate galactose phosphotransferase [Verrucomicrobiaceae bacterium]|nr:UDP-phosphate galactose phosphotransferase [Verrucomicrobiaceae bacterium]
MAKGRKETLSVQALQFVDAALVYLAFVVSAAIRDDLLRVLVKWKLWEGNENPGEIGLAELTPLLFVIIPLTPIALDAFGFYRHPLRKRIRDSLVQMFKSLIIVGVVVGVLVIILQLGDSLSRLTLGASVPIAVAFVLLREGLVRSVVLHSVRAEDAKEAVIYVGTRDSVKEFEKGISSEALADYKVVAQYEPSKGSPEEFTSLLKKESVARVIFAPKRTEFGELAELVEICELQGVESWISADFIQTQVARPDFDSMGGKPMLVLRSTPELSWALWVKGAIDFLGAALVLSISIVLLWWWVAILIKIGSPKGPIFFRQKRAGRYGKPFTMWKFRTMHADAEAQLDSVKKSEGNEMSGPVFKLENDPRVFGFGNFLRRTSIDELPQLLNVLRGDMSLVGPRPLPLYEVEQFAKSEHRRRLSVKPGITCLWQVGGRNKISSFEEWVRLDLKYIDNWSLWLDLKILLKTVPVVLSRRGSK